MSKCTSCKQKRQIVFRATSLQSNMKAVTQEGNKRFSLILCRDCTNDALRNLMGHTQGTEWDCFLIRNGKEIMPNEAKEEGKRRSLLVENRQAWTKET